MIYIYIYIPFQMLMLSMDMEEAQATSTFPNFLAVEMNRICSTALLNSLEWMLYSVDTMKMLE